MYLYGASGHCKVIIDIINSNYKHLKIDIIFDDNPKDDIISNINVVLGSNKIWNKEDELIIGIGDNLTRKKIAEKINAHYLKAIHKNATISHFAQIGQGSVVMAGAVLNAHAIVGKHCIINSGAIVEHDVQIEDFVHVAPNASIAGNVKIKEGANIGIGASVIQGLTIGKWSFVGAGAVILKDVPDFAVIVGNPGKIIKYNKPQTP